MVKYTRQITDRVKRVCRTIHENGGILFQGQVQVLEFAGKSERACQDWIKRMVDDEILARPTDEQKKRFNIREQVVWLGWRGALLVAQEDGKKVEPPKSNGEKQLREYAERLKEEGFHWHRTPSLSNLDHDRLTLDFVLKVKANCRAVPHLEFLDQVPERVFRADRPTVKFPVKVKRRQTTVKEREVYPDHFMRIKDTLRTKKLTKKKSEEKTDDTSRLLVEVDMATHSHTVIREKLLACAFLINSRVYRDEYAKYNSGRWLWICKSQRRMDNVRKIAKEILGPGTRLFWFTTIERALDPNVNVLLDKIWYQPTWKWPGVLFRPSTG